MALFEHFFPSRPQSPIFVTASAIGYYLERLFEQAEHSIVIISPYIKISLRIRSILMDKINNGIKVTVVHRESFDYDGMNIKTFKRKNLHAKCFFTDKAVLIGSMNLYDYSQINNDEMGIFLTKKDNLELYENIEKEVCRLCNSFSFEGRQNTKLQYANKSALQTGKRYARSELNRYFSFIDDHVGGIKQTRRGNIVLFYYSKSKYNNEERDGILYYVGQNTGSEVQMLKYGNKALYDCFTSGKGRIFLFRDDVFQGEFFVCMKPFQKDGKWVFPLKPEVSRIGRVDPAGECTKEA